MPTTTIRLLYAYNLKLLHTTNSLYTIIVRNRVRIFLNINITLYILLNICYYILSLIYLIQALIQE